MSDPSAFLAISTNLVQFSKALLDIKTTNELEAFKIRSQSMINDSLIAVNQAHMQISSLNEEIVELKKRISELEAAIAEKEKYTRREIVTGFFAYVSDAPIEGGTKHHKYCCNCYDSGVKATLKTKFVETDPPYWIVSCHKCGDQTESKVRPK